MDKTCRYLTKAEIIKINKEMITKFGGQHYLRNPESLTHMLEEVQGFLFGEELYPGLFNKASFLLERIICGHFFFDGNKRTGVEACKIFLELNGYRLILNYSDIIDKSKQISTNNIDRKSLIDWLKENSKKI